MIDFWWFSGTRTNAKISSFLRLPLGWHFGEGRAATDEAAKTAMSLDFAAMTNAWETDAFPGANGEIMLSIEAADAYFEAICETDGTISLRREKDGDAVQRWPRLSVAETISVIGHGFSPRLACDTSGSSTTVIGIPKRGGSSVWRFETPARSEGAEFQSSTRIARKIEAAPVVHTLQHSITNSRPRLYFGTSNPEIFLITIRSAKPQSQATSATTT